MNKCTIIGNLTRDPETRITQSGVSVTSFTVAVNGRAKQGEQAQTDYFRVTAWRQLGENCQKYLAKGRKVCVIGPVAVRTYQSNDGGTRASLGITAEDVEFLTPKGESSAASAAQQPSSSIPAGGYTQVEREELPF